MMWLPEPACKSFTAQCLTYIEWPLLKSNRKQNSEREDARTLAHQIPQVLVARPQQDATYLASRVQEVCATL